MQRAPRPTLGALALVLAACAHSPRSASTPDTQPETRTMPTRILIATTSHDRKGDTGEPTGAYLPEIVHPYDVFVAAGYELELASVRGGEIPLDGVDRSDPAVAAFLDDPERMAWLRASRPSVEIDPARYAAIFFAGGHGAMWDLPADGAFARATARIHDGGGVVGAVCHGPAALVDVQLADGSYLVAGREVSAFTNEEEHAVELDRVVPFLLEDRLRERGARYTSAPMWQSHVAVADRLVTGQNPASARAVAEAMVRVLRESR